MRRRSARNAGGDEKVGDIEQVEKSDPDESEEKKDDTLEAFFKSALPGEDVEDALQAFEQEEVKSVEELQALSIPVMKLCWPKSIGALSRLKQAADVWLGGPTKKKPRGGSSRAKKKYRKESDDPTFKSTKWMDYLLGSYTWARRKGNMCVRGAIRAVKGSNSSTWGRYSEVEKEKAIDYVKDRMAEREVTIGKAEYTAYRNAIIALLAKACQNASSNRSRRKKGDDWGQQIDLTGQGPAVPDIEGKQPQQPRKKVVKKEVLLLRNFSF